MGSIKEVCQDLDDLVAEFFCVTQDLFESQHDMQRLISEGLILMAKVTTSICRVIGAHFPVA